MAEKITYYAIFDEFGSRCWPGGVLRRVVNDEGQGDDAFSRDLKWEFSPLLYSAGHGNTILYLVPVSKEEASRIAERIREVATAPASLRFMPS